MNPISNEKLVQAYYIPAISPIVFQALDQKYGIDMANKVFWWTQQSLFQYPWLLSSAFYSYEESMKIDKSFRNYLNAPKEAFIWGDSGGYQAQTLGASMDTPRVLKWYEDNCNFGFIQDFPAEFLQLGEGVRDWVSFDEFKKGAEATARSNQDFENYKKAGGKCKIYNILHGRNLDQMEFWYQTMKNDHFDGWALGMKPGVPYRIVFSLAHAYSKGIRDHVHILGVSGMNAIPVLVYAAKYIDFLTFDSTSYAIGNRFHRYFNPLNIRSKLLVGDKSISKYDKLPCPCPVCSSVKNVAALYQPNALSGTIISTHNLYWTIWYTERLRELMQVESDFMDFVEGSCREETKIAIEYLDYSIKYGFEQANSRYMHIMNQSHKLFEDEGSRMSFLSPDLGVSIPEETKPSKNGKKKKKGSEEESGVVKPSGNGKKEKQEEKLAVAEVLLPLEACQDWL